jgi:hypothetical protein
MTFLLCAVATVVVAGASAQSPISASSIGEVANQGDSLATDSLRRSALFERSDESSLLLNPLNALSRGDLRFADQFGDLVSDEYFASVKANAQADLQGARSVTVR